jgi:predicted DNA binding CopG/RHH family protein
MTSRRKITDEAQSEVEADEDEKREQLTQRMPEALVERVDEVADKLGMSRNACINMLVEQGLDNWD